jgi:type I restriction enzyme S subunit
MSDWEMSTIGEVADIFDGPHATPVKTNTGPWFLSISSLKQGQLDLSESAHLSEADFEKWARRVTPCGGDVLFSYETRLGEAALMPPGIRACLGRRMGLLRPKPGKADSRFLLYAYLGPKFQQVIRERSIHGATVDRIPLVDLPGWPIRLPSFPEQQAIAELLGALDDKIAINDRIARTAFDLADARYVQVVIDAVHSKSLGDLIELKYGKALPSGDRVEGRFPVYGSGGVTGTHDKPLVNGPGVIVGRKGTVGTVYWSERSFFPIDTTFYVEPRRYEVPMEFTFYMLKHLGLDGMNSDSAVPGLNRSNALALQVKIPDQAELQRFHQETRPLFALRESLSVESASLAELRDAFLPRLMSGEICVWDAEKVVEEVT